MTAPSPSPNHHHHWTPSPSPSSSFIATTRPHLDHQSPHNVPVYFTPPLIAMVVFVAAGFLLITHSRLLSRHVVTPSLQLLRRWRRRRRRLFLSSSAAGTESGPHSSSFNHSDGFHVFSPYGLDESAIKTIPLSIYTGIRGGKNRSNGNSRNCAVCLFEFEEDDYVRTLSVCSHVFHVDCIDAWLRSHANCPLCRAGVVLRSESPFIPEMAARIRPSLDDEILESIMLRPWDENTTEPERNLAEIVLAEHSPSPRRIRSEDRLNRPGFLLKRSHSFGFERNLPFEGLVLEPATASPLKYRRGSFWNKRLSPFGSSEKSRMFSFRHRQGIKSPLFRRRIGGGGLLPEWNGRYRKSSASPMFMKTVEATASSSSRLRCGDPEALLSPERFSRQPVG